MSYENPFDHRKDDGMQGHIPLDSSEYRVGPVFHGDNAGDIPPKHKKKKTNRGKVIAICLACLFGLGLAGTSTALVLSQLNDGNQTTLQMGTREPTQLNTVDVETGEKMTLPEVYAMYVNSTVGISTEVTSTNVFGQQVSGVAQGSGFIISEDGYIVTNYHVIEGARSINVSMYDGTEHAAQLVGYDEDNDLAVLKIEASGLTPVVLGNSDNMNVGEAVMAIGNPLGELTFTYTTGVISALNRSITVNGSSYNMLQTDCAINEGNSGGPLFNEYGEVIGIVTAKYASSEIEGLGFAIPINSVVDLIQDIIENGRVTGKAYMGISVSTVTEAIAQQYNLQVGACVELVEEGSCAERAGLQKSDIITQMGDTEIQSKEDLIAAKKEYKAGETTSLTVYRSGETLTLSITFDEEITQTDTSETQQPQTTVYPGYDNGSGGGNSWGYYYGYGY